MLVARCTNNACTEHNIDKPDEGAGYLYPGEYVICGECGHPCDSKGAEPPPEDVEHWYDKREAVQP